MIPSDPYEEFNHEAIKSNEDPIIERDKRIEEELRTLLNRNSLENTSGTPDFILARYMLGCLNAFTEAVNNREKWYGREQDPRFGTPVNYGLVEGHD